MAVLATAIATVGALAALGTGAEELAEISGYLAGALLLWLVTRNDADLLPDAALAAALVLCWALTV